MRYLIILGLLSAVFISVPGCKKGPPVVPVTGMVTLEGEALEGANVNFTPVAENGLEGFGKTDASGKFILSNQVEPDAGVLPGEYKVTVRKAIEKWDGKSYKEVPGGEPIKDSTAVESIPRKYSSLSSTELKATVAKEGENKFTFDLQKK